MRVPQAAYRGVVAPPVALRRPLADAAARQWRSATRRGQDVSAFQRQVRPRMRAHNQEPGRRAHGGGQPNGREPCVAPAHMRGLPWAAVSP